MKYRICLSLLLTIIILAACSTPPTTRAEQTIDGLRIAIELPTRATVARTYDLFVTLYDATGQPINDATVFLDLDMPAMPMAVNQPIATPLGDGRYHIPAAYSMDGEWIITVHAQIGNREYQALFEQRVAP
ncbi:MAG TPA: FixH family protein [Roseiflexaceae bacterium]|nr:FixH family protein [Roseiflexaceae bacterium]HMP39632.1 FixH family protein [Roseiflexaceae bacterium]